MNKPKINIIAAISQNRGLGKDNKLLFRIGEDMKRFKTLTTGHVVIMGRKTFESIGHPLPNRINIIVTRDKTFTHHKLSNCENCEVFVFHSLEESLEKASFYCHSEFISESRKMPKHIRYSQCKRVRHDNQCEIFIIGGGQIYGQAIHFADKLYLTVVEGNYEADTFFPDYSQFKKVVKKETKESDGYRYTFLELERS